jgi:hypothetical protein
VTSLEEAELRAMGQDLAAAAQSRWQPACIARAFATPDPDVPVLTMQGWIDLDAARSPLLDGEIPSTADELDAAFAAFGLKRSGLNPEEAAAVVDALMDAVDDAFALALPMSPAGASTSGAAEDDGFGSWLPLFACLVTQCGLLPQFVLALRVDRAFALVAALRRNQGWQPTGTPYALRESAAKTTGVTP